MLWKCLPCFPLTLTTCGLCCQLFARLQDEQPDFAEKIIAVNSDLTQKEMNLSKGDQATLAEHINIVFHCAATIRFNEPLK